MPIVKKTRTVRESDIEKKVCKHAQSLGWITPKFKSPMNRGVLDRIFMRGRPGENGVTPQLVYVEFKAPGKKPTDQQDTVHKQYREMGFPVWVIDNADEGYFLLAMHSD